MKKSNVILVEVLMILCLLVQLMGKISIEEFNFNFDRISFKANSAEEVISRDDIVKTQDFVYMSPYLWTQVYVNPAEPRAIRNDFYNQRATLLKQENKTSDPSKWGVTTPDPQSSKTDFLWTYSKVNPYNTQPERNSFFIERTILSKEEKKVAKTKIPEKDTELLPDKPTEFLWTDVKVYPYGVPTTRENFSVKRAELLKQENNR